MSECNAGDLSKFLRPKKRTYVKVTESKRHQIIELMQREQLNIKTAAARLNINYSAAKHIVKVFRQENRLLSSPKKVKADEVAAVGTPKSVTDLSPVCISDLGTSGKTPVLTSTKFATVTKEVNEKAGIFDFRAYTTVINDRYYIS
eukprot:TRINITY_DN2178_c0_g1_i15.p1 TRINITY_DN2178_c0_g1~~TRINITY_DN2178_c0_g1_i15.p1  ORF type:complete len:146 (-),score=18.58 TRINITY_DN2178_c0_g1_i15:30-467(-)